MDKMATRIGQGEAIRDLGDSRFTGTGRAEVRLARFWLCVSE